SHETRAGLFFICFRIWLRHPMKRAQGCFLFVSGMATPSHETRSGLYNIHRHSRERGNLAPYRDSRVRGNDGSWPNNSCNTPGTMLLKSSAMRPGPKVVAAWP